LFDNYRGGLMMKPAVVRQEQRKVWAKELAIALAAQQNPR